MANGGKPVFPWRRLVDAAAASVPDGALRHEYFGRALQDSLQLFYPCTMTLSDPSGAAIFCAVVAAPFGALGIRTRGDALYEIVYLPPSCAPRAPANALAERSARQVERYLGDPDFRFDLPLAPAGTPFQRKVWQVIAAIPRGEVMTYGAVARRIASAPRAVGQACGANWFPLVIPCHRVIAAAGLGGFSSHDDPGGFHLGVKRWLLAHEGVRALA